MRPSVCLIVSILLVVVATIPQGRPGGDPRAWTTYKIPLPHPSFAPPDLGPLYLPQDYFDDYPDIKTSPQKQPVRQRNLLYHNRHQNEIANRWRETGEPPTEQEVLNRRQEIREMIRKAMIVEQEKIRDPVGFVPPQLRRVRNRRFETMKQIEVQIQDKTRAIKTLRQAHLEPDDRRLLGECQQKLEDSETIMVVCARIEEKIRAQIKKLSVQQQPFEMVSKQYKQIAHEMQQRETKLTKVRDQQEQTKRAATNARKCIRKCKERITGRPRMIARMEAELRKLRDELETLKGADDEDRIEDKTEGQTEGQTKDGNNISIASLEDGARRWIQGVGGFLQDMNQRVSTKGGNFGVRPFNFLPKPGLIGVP